MKKYVKKLTTQLQFFIIKTTWFFVLYFCEWTFAIKNLERFLVSTTQLVAWKLYTKCEIRDCGENTRIIWKHMKKSRRRRDGANFITIVDHSGAEVSFWAHSSLLNEGTQMRSGASTFWDSLLDINVGQVVKLMFPSCHFRVPYLVVALLEERARKSGGPNIFIAVRISVSG